MNAPTVYVIFAVLVVGLLALWANPRRRVNQLFFTISLHAALWLWCLHTARSVVDGMEGLKWLRYSSAVGAVIPFHLWAIKEAIIGMPCERGNPYRRLAVWAVWSAFLLYLPLTYYFVPRHSTPENPVYGWGFYAYTAGLLLTYAFLAFSTLSLTRKQTGVSKIELQIILLGGSAAGLIIITLMALRPVLGGASAQALPLVILVFYASTAITITTHRIFDARHLLMLLLQRGLLVTVISSLVMLFWPWLLTVFSTGASLVLMVIFVLVSSAWLNQRLDVWLLRYPKAVQARLAAFDAAHSEVRTEELKGAFAKVLKGWGQTDRAFLLMDDDGQFEDSGLVLARDQAVLKGLREVHWATPERLMRERETPERRALAEFLEKHELGVVVHDEGPTMKLIVALGARPSRRPFTFPEVTQLRELVSIFDSSLSRTQLLAKAQRAEQLATVGLLGAGVAHEIRNPLVSIKTFAQLLPKHYSDEAFRERFSRLITDEVARIDRLTEQLLDLAAPRSLQQAEVGLHELIRTSLDLVSARVVSKNIKIHTNLVARPDIIFSDDHGLKQVILNLCFNAVQAQEVMSGDHQITLRVSTYNEGKNVVMVIADDGPGIPDEARLHLFEPFHSTKSNGFGLGLTVCGEILSQLDSNITLDPYEPGKGAVFRIHLPCPPRSS